MATYAAYRHIELDKVGAGKKRVLKPPGGGTSDIFGGSESEKPVLQKNDVASTNGSAGSNGSTNGSNSSSSSVSSNSSSSSNGNSNIAATFENGHGIHHHQDTTEKKVNGTLSNASSVSTARGSRVPPGGFSSGLW